MIEATPNHPFYVHGSWFQVRDLSQGDTLKSFAADGELIVVDSLVGRKGTFKVYNFTVADYHTYYVGQGEVLVHNCGSYNSIRKTLKGTANQAHHIIQDAAARIIPGYSKGKAPAIPLFGGSRLPGSAHDLASRAQRSGRPGGGTYGSERRIGYRALRAAGVSIGKAKAAIRRADKYFMGDLGATLKTPTRTPGR